MGALKRISRLALTFLQADMVYARGKVRMSRRQHPSDACQAAVLSAGGIVTAAALTCIAEVDMQMIAADVTPRDQAAPSTSLVHGCGGISGLDFTEYFLPAHQRDKLRDVRNRYRASAIFPLCSPVVRAAALEAYVRMCCTQYLLLNEKQKRMAADVTQKSGMPASVR